MARSLAAIALLACGACSKEVTDFSTGLEPWEVPADAPAEWPAMPVTPGELATWTGTRLGTGSSPAYFVAHGRALLAAPIADVWAALQWRPGALVAVFPDVPTVDCEPTSGVEPAYALSYDVLETPNDFGALGRENWFVVRWRGGTTAGAGGTPAIAKVNVKAQKVDGTSYILLMRESIVATPAPGGGTELEIVRHINAPDESEASAAEWIGLWVRALQAELDGTREALIPASYCF
jgi:hypothetical protein